MKEGGGWRWIKIVRTFILSCRGKVMAYMYANAPVTLLSISLDSILVSGATATRMVQVG